MRLLRKAPLMRATPNSTIRTLDPLVPTPAVMVPELWPDGVSIDVAVEENPAGADGAVAADPEGAVTPV
jgi:hypothetical protein